MHPRPRFLEWVLSLLLLLSSSAAAERHLLVLAGQSNAEGVAPYAGAGVPDSLPGVLVWNAFGNRIGTWTTLAPGLSFDTTMFGPEFTMMERLVGKLPQDTFAILKVAVGATSMQLHWRSPSSGDTAGEFYLALLRAVDSARKSHPLGDMPLDGFFWMQGESDALEESSASLYRERLEAFVVDLRREWSDTSMPWILGLIDVQPAWPWADLVREGTSDAAQALERVSLVETVGLPTDGAHYTSEGLKRLGILFADRWLTDKGLVPSTRTRDPSEIRRVQGGRLMISRIGPDPILEARVVSLDGRGGPWMGFRHSMVLTRPPGRTGERRGLAILQVRRGSGRVESLRVAWP